MRPDSPSWIAAKAVGDHAEYLVAEYFRRIGFDALKRVGKAAADLELRTSLEIKHDKACERTGNVAIEVECNGKPSGIETTQAQWWVWVIRDEMLMVPVEQVRALAKTHGQPKPAGDGMRARIVLVPLTTLREASGIIRRRVGVNS